MTIQIPRIRVERWTLVEFAGAGLLGAGVWAEWGSPWAYMLWGGLLLGAAMLHAYLTVLAIRRDSQ